MSKEEKSKKSQRVKKSDIEDKIGYIQVLSIREEDDGGCSMDFEVDDKFIEFYKESTGRKRVTQKGLGGFIENLITKAIEEHEDYRLIKACD